MSAFDAAVALAYVQLPWILFVQKKSVYFCTLFYIIGKKWHEEDSGQGRTYITDMKYRKRPLKYHICSSLISRRLNALKCPNIFDAWDRVSSETLWSLTIRMRQMSGSRKIHCTSLPLLWLPSLLEICLYFLWSCGGSIDVVLLQKGEDNWVLHHAKWRSGATFLLERIVPMEDGCAGSGHSMPGRMPHKRKPLVLNLTHMKYNFFFAFSFIPRN